MKEICGDDVAMIQQTLNCYETQEINNILQKNGIYFYIYFIQEEYLVSIIMENLTSCNQESKSTYTDLSFLI